MALMDIYVFQIAYPRMFREQKIRTRQIRDVNGFFYWMIKREEFQ